MYAQVEKKKKSKSIISEKSIAQKKQSMKTSFEIMDKNIEMDGKIYKSRPVPLVVQKKVMYDKKCVDDEVSGILQSRQKKFSKEFLRYCKGEGIIPKEDGAIELGNAIYNEDLEIVLPKPPDDMHKSIINWLIAKDFTEEIPAVPPPTKRARITRQEDPNRATERGHLKRQLSMTNAEFGMRPTAAPCSNGDDCANFADKNGTQSISFYIVDGTPHPHLSNRSGLVPRSESSKDAFHAEEYEMEKFGVFNTGKIELVLHITKSPCSDHCIPKAKALLDANSELTIRFILQGPYKNDASEQKDKHVIAFAELVRDYKPRVKYMFLPCSMVADALEDETPRSPFHPLSAELRLTMYGKPESWRAKKFKKDTKWMTAEQATALVKKVSEVSPFNES